MFERLLKDAGNMVTQVEVEGDLSVRRQENVQAKLELA